MTNQSPDPTGTTFDQSGQTVEKQTNIAGNLYTYNYALAVRPSILAAPSPDLFWLTAGRGDELAQLNQWYDAVLADKTGEQPRTVVVTGAAGIGKREIVQRWALALPNHERPPTVMQSSYPPVYFDDGQQESFYATQPHWQAAWGSHVPPLRLRYPHAELLGGRGWLALAAQVVDLSSAARHVFDRATPPHTTPDAAAIQRQMNELFVHALGDAPLVVLLEYGEEGPPTLQLLIERWNKAFYNLPFLLVLIVDHPQPLHQSTTNEEETEWLRWLRKGTAPHASRSFPLLHVGPLRRQAVEALLTPASAHYAGELHNLTAGVPDLLRELLRHWEQAGLAHRQADGRWQLATASRQSLPGTLYEQYIEAPLQACAARAQALGFDVSGETLLDWLNDAVWEGDTFTDEALAHAVGQHGEALEDFQALLDEVLSAAGDGGDDESRPGALLVELEEPVILYTADVERRERGMALYRFDPPLLAQLLQAQQTAAERTQRGTRYLQALIDAYHPLEREIAPLLIQLATQLGRLADAERFQQWIAPQADLDRAQLLLATLRATAIDGPSQQHFVRRVTEFFGTFHGKVHPRTFLPLLIDAATYAADLNQIGSQARLLYYMGNVYAELGEQQQALALYHEALPLRRKVGDIRGEAYTLINMGYVYAALGEQQQALALYREALPLFRKVGDIHGEAYTLTGMGSVYAELGEQQQALTLYHEALPLIRKVGTISGEAYTLTGMGGVYAELGEQQQALALYREALPLRRKVGDIHGEAYTLTGMGGVYAALGEQQQALALYHEALPLRRKVGDIRGEAATLTGMGEVFEDLDDHQRAIDLCEEALPLRRKVGDIRGEARTLTVLGDVFASLGIMSQHWNAITAPYHSTKKLAHLKPRTSAKGLLI